MVPHVQGEEGGTHRRPAVCAPVGVCGAVQSFPELHESAACLGRPYGLHRKAGRTGACERQSAVVCHSLQEMAGGDDRFLAERGGGEPRNSGAHRPAGHLQDYLAEQPASARAAALLLPEKQQSEHLEGRHADPGGVCHGVPGGAGRDGEQGTEPAEGAYHHAPRERTGGIRSLQGGETAHCQFLRHQQQPALPDRPEWKPSLDAFRSREHRQPV